MNKFKYLISSIVVFVLFLAANSSIYAANLSVNCAVGGSCTISPASTPLFQETGWVPGDSVTRTISVTNQDPAQSCDLTLATSNIIQNPSNFSSRLTSSINDSSVIYFSNFLSNLFTGGSISFGNVAANSTKTYNWTVVFDSTTGNEFQSANTFFDFNLNFTCNSSGGGNVLSAATAASCGDQTPTSAPNLIVSSITDNTVNLSWTAVSPVSHYMIRYGLSSGNYIYGAANVGNVTSYT